MVQFSEFIQIKSLSYYRICKTISKETTTCIRFTQRQETCNRATILEKVHMLDSNDRMLDNQR